MKQNKPLLVLEIRSESPSVSLMGLDLQGALLKLLIKKYKEIHLL